MITLNIFVIEIVKKSILAKKYKDNSFYKNQLINEGDKTCKETF